MSNILVIYCLSTLMIKKMYLKQQRSLSVQQIQFYALLGLLIVLTYLLKSCSLSFYGCTLWFLSSLSIKSLQIAINKILRKIWNLPRYSHTSIVLCTARINDMIFYRFSKFMPRCLDMDHPLVSFIISDSMHLAYSWIW